MQLNPLFLAEVLQHAVVTGVQAGFAQAHEANNNPELQGQPDLIATVVSMNVMAQLGRIFDLPQFQPQNQPTPDAPTL